MMEQWVECGVVPEGLKVQSEGKLRGRAECCRIVTAANRLPPRRQSGASPSAVPSPKVYVMKRFTKCCDSKGIQANGSVYSGEKINGK